MKEENTSPKRVYIEVFLPFVGRCRLVDKVKVVTQQSQVCNRGYGYYSAMVVVVVIVMNIGIVERIDF